MSTLLHYSTVTPFQSLVSRSRHKPLPQPRCPLQSLSHMHQTNPVFHQFCFILAAKSIPLISMTLFVDWGSCQLNEVSATSESVLWEIKQHCGYIYIWQLIHQMKDCSSGKHSVRQTMSCAATMCSPLISWTARQTPAMQSESWKYTSHPRWGQGHCDSRVLKQHKGSNRSFFSFFYFFIFLYIFFNQG